MNARRSRGRSLDTAALGTALARFKGRRILVIADLVADEFVVCRPQRVSREAPVLILEHEGAEVRLGGGANAAANIRALGGQPLPLGVLGPDEHGRHLRRLFKDAGVSTSRVYTEGSYLTPVKSRVLAGGRHASKQQVMRIDRVVPLAASAAARTRVREALGRFSGRLDGILVSDYGLGLITPGLVRAALSLARRRRVPITVDSRHRLLSFRGMTAVTPNEPEVEEALGVVIGSDRTRLESAGRQLLERLQCKAVLITRGGDGMSVFEAGRPPCHIAIHGSDEVTDVTGAGDTVIATFTLALAAGSGAVDAAHLANYAGGLVVMKRGTATVTAAELEAALGTAGARG